MNKNITIKDIIENPKFNSFKILAGEKGLNRKARSITVMDAPNPFSWTKGGEIILSSGYIFKININKFCDMIMEMHKAGISALFIKLKRFFDKLPDDVLRLADEIQFPIVEVPIHLAFIEVINPTLLQIINHQSEILRISEEIHKTFTSLVINNEDIQSIINVLSDILNEDILYYDLHLEKLYFSKNIDSIPSNIENFNLKDILEGYHYYTIGVNNEAYGYIIYLKAKEYNPKDDDYNALTHANTAIILAVQKKISSMQIEDKHKNEFVQDLIMNNIKFEGEAKNRAAIYGWDISKNICVMVVDIDNIKEKYLKLDHKSFNDKFQLIRERIFKNSIKIVKFSFKNAIYGKFSDSIVFILQPNGMDLKTMNTYFKKIGDEIRNVILKNFEFTVMVGFGDFKDYIMDIYKSYNEATMSIKIGRILYKENATILYKELSVYRLLYSIYKNEASKEFYTSSLGKIIEHDEKYNSELLRTLIYILENDWNLKNSAKSMYIHYNTIRYRYKKICELLNEDLNKNEIRLKLSLALKIHQMTE